MRRIIAWLSILLLVFVVTGVQAQAEPRGAEAGQRPVGSWRPKEVVFETREQMHRHTQLTAALAAALITALAVVAALIWEVRRRRRAEETLRESEQEFRSLAEAMPQIVWATRADGWNIYFNQQWVNYTGMTMEESYGHGWNKPFHPDDRKRAWDAWQRAT